MIFTIVSRMWLQQRAHTAAVHASIGGRGGTKRGGLHARLSRVISEDWVTDRLAARLQIDTARVAQQHDKRSLFGEEV